MERNIVKTVTFDGIQQTYDEIPYPGYPYPQSHPDYLATLATIFGMQPPPVEACRVLEIGCGTGGNIIPMSELLPHSSFLGIDISARHIAEGQAVIDALELPNITLRQLDMQDMPADVGQFDYIIAHGVYSWIPVEMQDTLLALCKHHLAPNGLVYMSYNTYPGWHMFGMLRDMMRYHTRDITDPHTRAEQASAFLDFLTDAIPDEHLAFRQFLAVYIDFLQRKIEQAGEQRNAFLLHDELADHNTPVYFSQFVKQATSHGLQYITETEVPSVMPDTLPPPIPQQLREMSNNLIDVEQYLDFLRGRTFRETLLCHDTVHLERMLNPKQVWKLAVSSQATPLSAEPDVHSSAAESFRGRRGGRIELEHQLTKAALVYLAEIWPASVEFPRLVSEVRNRLQQQPSWEDEAPWLTSEDKQHEEYVLSANLLKMFTLTNTLISLRMHPLTPGSATVEYPRARPLARYQAEQQTVVTNLLHERVKLTQLQRCLLPYLDGTRDRAALREVLATCERAHPQKETEAQQAETLEQRLEDMLGWMERSALLLADTEMS
jgi:methyltransferase-like protein/SAM-dependent methyltransferase